MKTYSARVELQKEDDGKWSVWVTGLPVCTSWGYTQEEAVANIQEAFALYIDTLIDEGLPIPLRPKSSMNQPLALT